MGRYKKQVWKNKRNFNRSICNWGSRYWKVSEQDKGGGILTKDRISTNTKITWADFKKAVDSGKKNGGKHNVFTFNRLCQSSWEAAQ